MLASPRMKSAADLLAMTSNSILVETRALRKYFRIRRPGFLAGEALLRAVDGVSLQILRGEIFGLVGESGCGKSTLGQTILHLYPPTSGEVLFEGVSLRERTAAELRVLRRKMQIIFQDPYASLDPRMTIGQAIREPLLIHQLVTAGEAEERIASLLRIVGLGPELRNRYPHEFSGGQQQRIAVARALAVNPTFLVADEPISAMDVSIQAQLVNLMKELQEQLGLTYLFISHDLRMMRYIASRAGVMYLGKIVETANRDELYDHPLHPYTRALLSAVPVPNPKLARSRQRIRLAGDVPSPIDLPKGCPFRSRCYMAEAICAEIEPPLRDAGSGHLVACHSRAPRRNFQRLS
jgi:oligopeptide transport system ATP-binding protein